MKNKRPNILIFNPDQMRADALHHLGNEASITPNMDKLLEDGVSFRNAYCQNPICSPSRCSFMSGWYPHVKGHRTMSYLMHEDEPVLLRELKDEGYSVWMNNRNDLFAAQVEGLIDGACNVRSVPSDKIEYIPNDRGEEDSDNYYSFHHGAIKTETGDYHDGDFDDVEQLIEYIDHAPEDKPSCMFIGLMSPHPPYMAPESYVNRIDQSKLPPRVNVPTTWYGKASMLKGIQELQGMENWSEDRWDELRTTYLAMCARVDDMFGRIVQALKDKGIYDDTAIFILSDHGDYTGDFGVVEKAQNTFEDCLTNVPLIVKPHKGVELVPGINNSMVELIDMYGTIEDFTGMKPTHTHFGKTLRHAMNNQEEVHRDVVFCEGGRLKSERHCTETASLPEGPSVKSEYYPKLKIQDSHGPEHTKATMCRSIDHKYVQRLYEMDEFYDLKKDPKELHNLIEDPLYRDVIMEFKERMLKWYQETCDVVPFQEDDRFTDDMLLGMLKGLVPKEGIVHIMKALEAGASIRDIMYGEN